MDFISVVILAVIQGIAEFLPISSSAHLIIFRDIFNIAKTTNININFIFDIALHLGTVLAIGLYFYKGFIQMISKGITKGKDIIDLAYETDAKQGHFIDGCVSRKKHVVPLIMEIMDN